MDSPVPPDFAKPPIAPRFDRQRWPKVEQARCFEAIRRWIPRGWQVQSMEYLTLLWPVQQVRIVLLSRSGVEVTHDINVRAGPAWGAAVAQLLEEYFKAEFAPPDGLAVNEESVGGGAGLG